MPITFHMFCLDSSINLYTDFAIVSGSINFKFPEAKATDMMAQSTTPRASEFLTLPSRTLKDVVVNDTGFLKVTTQQGVEIKLPAAGVNGKTEFVYPNPAADAPPSPATVYPAPASQSVVNAYQAWLNSQKTGLVILLI